MHSKWRGNPKSLRLGPPNPPQPTILSTIASGFRYLRLRSTPFGSGTGIMQESATANLNREREMGSTEKDKVEDIRQPSINTEPRTLNELNMERAMLTAERIYAEHPSEDFTKDAVDEATRGSSPAEDAGDANSLERDFGDLVQQDGGVVDPNFKQSKAPVPSEAPAPPTPPPT